MKDKQDLIIRKDGITYYRKKRKLNCDKLLAIKWNNNSLEKFKKIANKKNVRYQILLKQVLEEYIEGELNG